MLGRLDILGECRGVGFAAIDSQPLDFVAGILADDCEDDGDECTVCSCDDGSCSNAVIPPQCSSADTIVCGVEITPTSGFGTCVGTGTLCESGTCIAGVCVNTPADEGIHRDVVLSNDLLQLHNIPKPSKLRTVSLRTKQHGQRMQLTLQEFLVVLIRHACVAVRENGGSVYLPILQKAGMKRTQML